MVQEYVQKIDSLPMLPAVAVRVNELINDPASTGPDIAEVLRADQALTTKILKLANSSYYAIPGGVTDVQRALSFLGFNTIAQLVLGLSVFSLFREWDEDELSMPDFWRHSLAVAVGTELLAKRKGGVRPDEAFTCGLLHDVGKLVLHEIDSETLSRVYASAKSQITSFSKAEQAIGAPDHAELGSKMVEKWNLPNLIRCSVKFHHHSEIETLSDLSKVEKRMIQMVILANAVAVKNSIGNSGDFLENPLEPKMLSALEMSFEELEQFESAFFVEMEKAGAFLNAYR